MAVQFYEEERFKRKGNHYSGGYGTRACQKIKNTKKKKKISMMFTMVMTLKKRTIFLMINSIIYTIKAYHLKNIKTLRAKNIMDHKWYTNFSENKI